MLRMVLAVIGFRGVRCSTAGAAFPLFAVFLIIPLVAANFCAFVVESSLAIRTLDSLVCASKGLSAFVASRPFSVPAFVADEGVVFQRLSCLVPTESTADSFNVVWCFAGPALEVALLYSFLAPSAYRSWIRMDISGPSDLHCLVVACLTNTLGLLYSAR